VATTGGAVAASLVTSHDIQNNTIRSVDIHDGGVHLNDTSAWVQAQLSGVKHVGSLNGLVTSSGDLVSMTPDGIQFGPYADGGADHGSIRFNGMNGKHLSDIKNLVYYARYLAGTNTGGVGVPYLRVFLNQDTDHAIFSPNTQTPNPDVAQGPFHEWVATSGSWRYDDDAGFNPDESFQQLLTDHGSDTISGILVSVGETNGQDLQALLRWMQINGRTYTFGS
jgi:hypothetical protein